MQAKFIICILFVIWLNWNRPTLWSQNLNRLQSLQQSACICNMHTLPHMLRLSNWKTFDATFDLLGEVYFAFVCRIKWRNVSSKVSLWFKTRMTDDSIYQKILCILHILHILCAILYSSVSFYLRLYFWMYFALRPLSSAFMTSLAFISPFSSFAFLWVSFKYT